MDEFGAAHASHRNAGGHLISSAIGLLGLGMEDRGRRFWLALLRIGEATAASRAALILPRDVKTIFCFVLLNPRQDFVQRASSQQNYIEPADLVQLVDLAFRDLHPTAKLWPCSTQTLRPARQTQRRRLDCVLERLGILTALSVAICTGDSWEEMGGFLFFKARSCSYVFFEGG